ncbi:MAG: hypothetical protein WAL56_20710 [Candidatus Sulfotelmatobacter sp.]
MTLSKQAVTMINSQLLLRQLEGYALAAGAAGVGWLVVAQPASAEIVYTPVNQTIPFDTTFNLDLNNDGIIDFQIKNHEVNVVRYRADLFMLPVAASNRAAGEEFAPSALPGGVTIGENTKFPKDGVGKLAEWFFSFSTTLGPRYWGNWRHASNRYLGLKFVVNGEIHYGWARLSVNCVFWRPVSAKITGYAYETEPNTSIDAGQTKEFDGGVSDADPARWLNLPGLSGQGKSLGMLALGSSVLPVQNEEKDIE